MHIHIYFHDQGALVERIRNMGPGTSIEVEGVTTERMKGGHWITHVTGHGGVKLSRSPEAAAKYHEFLIRGLRNPSTAPVPGREPKQRPR